MRVEVRGRSRALIWIRDGALVAVSSAEGEAALGDLVQEFWPSRDLTPTWEGPARLPAGVRLLRAGVLDQGELAFALRQQARRRLRELLRWSAPRVEVRRVPAAPISGTTGWDVRDAVVDATRALVAPLSRAEFSLTEGWWLRPRASPMVARLVLPPAEAAMRSLLEQGASAREVLYALGEARAVRRGLHAWRQLGMVGPRSDATHALLARKTRALRRGASGDALLGLEPGDHGSRKHAFRRLARSLHPDRFEADLGEASTRVFRALVEAERGKR